MKSGKVIAIEERIPKLKAERKRKANRRLIFYVSCFFLLILIVVYLQSSLSKVGNVVIEGNYYIADTDILEAGDLSEKTSFWNLSTEQLETELVQSIPELADVTVARHFPNHLSIEIIEFSRVAYFRDGVSFLPVLENGVILAPLEAHEVPTNAPILTNWNETNVDDIAFQLKELPQSLIQRISEIERVPSDVYAYDVALFMNDGFEVRSTIRDFANKMKKYPAVVKQIDGGKKGIIHLNLSNYFEEYGEVATSESEG